MPPPVAFLPPVIPLSPGDHEVRRMLATAVPVINYHGRAAMQAARRRPSLTSNPVSSVPKPRGGEDEAHPGSIKGIRQQWENLKAEFPSFVRITDWGASEAGNPLYWVEVGDFSEGAPPPESEVIVITDEHGDAEDDIARSAPRFAWHQIANELQRHGGTATVMRRQVVTYAYLNQDRAAAREAIEEMLQDEPPDEVLWPSDRPITSIFRLTDPTRSTSTSTTRHNVTPGADSYSGWRAAWDLFVGKASSPAARFTTHTAHSSIAGIGDFSELDGPDAPFLAECLEHVIHAAKRKHQPFTCDQSWYPFVQLPRWDRPGWTTPRWRARASLLTIDYSDPRRRPSNAVVCSNSMALARTIFGHRQRPFSMNNTSFEPAANLVDFKDRLISERGLAFLRHHFDKGTKYAQLPDFFQRSTNEKDWRSWESLMERRDEALRSFVEQLDSKLVPLRNAIAKRVRNFDRHIEIDSELEVLFGRPSNVSMWGDAAMHPVVEQQDATTTAQVAVIRAMNLIRNGRTIALLCRYAERRSERQFDMPYALRSSIRDAERFLDDTVHAKSLHPDELTDYQYRLLQVVRDVTAGPSRLAELAADVALVKTGDRVLMPA